MCHSQVRIILQTNGLTERCNRTLISLIRKYAHAYPKHWAEFLPLFEFAYNNAVHSSSKMLPFEAEKGYKPPLPVTLLKYSMEYDSSAARANERSFAKITWSNL